jgi:predicted CoA-binding protein
MENTTERTVAVLGASDDESRYSYKAVQRLKRAGFRTIPVNPALDQVLGLQATASLADIQEPVDTVTVYLSAKRSTPLAGEISALKPGRVILNPGAENPHLEQTLDRAGIPWLHACSLVMLSTGQF